MGLDFTHCDAHWSYGGFNRFRTRLAAVVGIDLEAMEGFSKGDKGKSWAGITDPIVDLLNHSDCDDVLTSKQCAVIAPRLRELVKHWPDGDYDKKQALELADGMDAAAGIKESLEFC